MATSLRAIQGWSTGTKVAVGAGSLLAVAAAVYLLTGKRGERNRAKLKKLGATVKRELVSRLHSLENLNQHGRVLRRKLHLKAS